MANSAFLKGWLRRMGSILDSLTKLNMLTKINYGAAFLSAIIVFGLMIYNTYATGARYLFNAPPPGSTEISTFLIPVFVFLALAYTLEQERHVIVDMVISRLGIRKQLVLSVIATIFIAIFGAILVWKGTELSLGKISERSSTDLLLPLFPFYVFVPIGGLLLLLQSIRNIRTYVLSLTRRPPASESSD